MAKLVFDQFFGRASRRDARALPRNYGQVAENIWLGRDDLRPLEQPSFVFGLTKTGVQTIYRFGQALNSTTQHWFHWSTDVDVIKGQIANDTNERTFFTGDGVPKFTTAALGTAGTNLPSAARPLALPAPTSPPVLTPVSGTGSGAAAKRQYVYRFTNEFGDVSAPSPVAEVDIVVGQHVTLTALQTATSNAAPIATRQIYRADAGVYLFVAEINATDETFTDDLAADELGADPIDSTLWDGPPDDLQGLVAMPNGMAAGFTGFDVRFCVPYRMYAWPQEDYVYTVDYLVVALVPLDQSLAVLTKGVPYVLTGIDPSGMAQERTKFLQPCVSKRGAVSTGGSCLFPSAKGICEIGPGVANVLTGGLFSPEDWEQFNPSTIVAAWHDGWYVGTYVSGATRKGFMFAPAAQAWVDLPTFNATAFYRDTVTDALYCAINDDVYRFRGGPTVYPMRWRSKIEVTDLTDFGWVRVLSDEYPVTVNTYADGQLRDTSAVLSSEPAKIGGQADEGIAAEWEVEVVGPGHARSIVLATNPVETREVT